MEFTSYWTTLVFKSSLLNGFLRPSKYDLALDNAITGKLYAYTGYCKFSNPR